MTWDWWNHNLLDPGFMTWFALPFPNCDVPGKAGGSSAQARSIDPSVGPRCGTNPLFISGRNRSILKLFRPSRVGFEIPLEMFMFLDVGTYLRSECGSQLLAGTDTFLDVT